MAAIATTLMTGDIAREFMGDALKNSIRFGSQGFVTIKNWRKIWQHLQYTAQKVSAPAIFAGFEALGEYELVASHSACQPAVK